MNVEESPEGAARRRAVNPSARPPTPVTPTRHVLVVDDDPDIREVTQLCLELLGGWFVSTASCGPEALEQAARVDPNVILLDVMMPGWSGVETFRCLRDDH